MPIGIELDSTLDDLCKTIGKLLAKIYPLDSEWIQRKDGPPTRWQLTIYAVWKGVMTDNMVGVTGFGDLDDEGLHKVLELMAERGWKDHLACVYKENTSG